MQAIVRDMAHMQVNPIVGVTSHNSQAIVEKQPVTEEYIQMWIQQLEQWTNTFYNEHGARDPVSWQEAQAKLVQFQKIHDPSELCIGIIKNTRNSLILYQATLCLKNAIANDFRSFRQSELFKLFQFLYEFLCSQSLDNDMCVNETTALICAMILKRIASEKPHSFSLASYEPEARAAASRDADQIAQVINALCSHIKEPSETLSKKVAASMMLSSLLLECQMTNRATLLGLRVWKHLHARRQFELHLKQITEVCLAAINLAFSSNLLNPALSQNRETQILFHFVGSLIQCVENALAFNSSDSGGCSSGGDRVLRVIQSRTINMLSQTNEHDQRLKTLREWCKLVMSPTVVQFLFDLYTTIKSMINMVPGFTWPTNLLKNCLNCLYYLSDVHNNINIERRTPYAEFVGNLMVGAVKMMDAETQGIDDTFQIACLITSISMHASETRDTMSMIKADHFIPFLDSAQRFTCKVFTQVATTSQLDIEEEEEKTIDALLDFWYHLLRNIDAEIRSCKEDSMEERRPKVDADGLKAYSRVIVESYISCHLHKPLGQLVPKADQEAQELDLDQADEQDDNSIHAQQLVSFGQIARFDALHTAKLLIELLSTRVTQFEALLTQYINTTQSPQGLKDWEYINDDLHWLLLMLQHYLTQTGYGETGFMCNEILEASLSFGANVQKTLEAFEKFDFTMADTDPIVRLIIITLKLCQIEMVICQSGKTEWLSMQTNGTLTTMLCRFCLTYLYPRESDYSVIGENMNYCFGQDATTADKFLRFVIEHTCCIIVHMKSDPHIVRKNISFLTQIQLCQPCVMAIMMEAEPGSMTSFVRCLKPDELTGFSPQVAKLILKLATRLFVAEKDWNNLIEFFTKKWSTIMASVHSNQHKTEAVVSKFLEFCDFAVGVCEACDQDSSERLFEQLLVPIVKALPEVMTAFNSYESVIIAIFDLLHHIVKAPMLHLERWDNQVVESFYDRCIEVIRAYSLSPLARDRGTDEENVEDIVALLNLAHEVIRGDWGHSFTSSNALVEFAMEKLSVIIKPEYLQFPKIRSLYYRLLVHLVDEHDRLSNLSDVLLNMTVSSVLVALQSKFDKEVDNHVYTIIGILCRTIYYEKETPISERLHKFMQPVLPALFQATINDNSYTLNMETAEMVGPAFFSLRFCFMSVYSNLVKDLIVKQDDPYAQAKVRALFENLESKISPLSLNRSACREFNQLFVPFLAELHNYITTK